MSSHDLFAWLVFRALFPYILLLLLGGCAAGSIVTYLLLGAP